MPALLFDLDGTLVDQLAAGRKNGLGVGLLSGGYGPHELEGQAPPRLSRSVRFAGTH